jgi:homoserine O-acetyltransferase
MVNAQYNLLDHFGIDKLFSIAGGSMGGMQVLQFISNFPDKSKTVIPIATTSSHSAQNIAFNELGDKQLQLIVTGKMEIIHQTIQIQEKD